MNSLLGQKIDQTQGFLEDGTRVPLSIISVAGNVITQFKTEDKDGYNSIQIGFGNNKKPKQAIAGHIKKAGLTSTPRFFREVRVDELPTLELGTSIAVAEVFEAGDIVDISGTSKGKGYAGVIKRHHFHGGPKTHGQSDRERAPGASGQGTTPGRVYKGKRMAGNMGNENVTVKNLLVLGIDGDTILVKGLIPGVRGGLVVIKKVGTKKKFTPLYSDKKVEEVEETVAAEAPIVEEVAAPAEEAPAEVKEEVTTVEETVADASEKVETPEEKVETAEENVTTADETVETPEEPKESVESAADISEETPAQENIEEVREDAK